MLVLSPSSVGSARFIGSASLTVMLWLKVSCAQTLDLPPRPANAPTGTQFTNIISSLTLKEREHWIYAQILNGNVPDFLRSLIPINVSASIAGTNHIAMFHVIPDYLAVGSDADYFLTPMTPILAQRLCDRLGFALPTRKMVNQVWTNATVRLNPQPIPPSAEMVTVPVFAAHNAMVRSQRDTLTNTHPLGALVSGDKKDLVVSGRIYTNFASSSITKPVVIYGWHYPTGSPIQPLYNGHGETYVDYSHGVRLVQMSLTVDNTPHTITSVLTNPFLAALLSDDDAAPNTIPLPRYTVAPMGPVIMTHPRSQALGVGDTASFRVLVIGDAPLAYRWQVNGDTIGGATTSALVIPTTQTSNAGSYTVAVTNLSGSVTSRPAPLKVSAAANPVLFEDDFESNGASRWDLFWGAVNGVPDYTVDWAFDYAAIPYTFNGATQLIPAAPDSPNGSTRALRLSVNNNDLVGAAAGVSLYAANKRFRGNYSLKFNLWINYPGGPGGVNSTGSTQHATCGINHLGSQVNWAATSAASSDGLWFAVDGEGGTFRDYRAYAGNSNGPPTELLGYQASGLSESNNAFGMFPALFPASRFESGGAPGKNWVRVELQHTNGIVQWLLDGTIVAQRMDATTTSEGNIMIGLMDVFASIANPQRDSFILVDNVRVECLNTSPVRFESSSRLPSGDVQLLFAGVPCANYALEASTNAASWLPIGILSPTTIPASFIDTNTANYEARLFRARQD